MNKNAYQTELDQVRFTPEGRKALTDALMREAAPAPRRVNWVRRGLAAGIAAAVLAGSAVAASGPVWSYFFGDLNESQRAVIGTLSQTLPAAESNGTTMTPLEAFGDEDFYYLLLEICPPEGTTLPNYSKDEGYYQFMDGEGSGMTVTDANGQKLFQNFDYHWIKRASDDSLLTAVIRLWPSDGADISGDTGKILHIPGLWVQRSDKEYEPVLTGSWDFNIGAYTGGIESKTLNVEGITTSLNYCESLTLDSMRISPLGMRWHYHWEGLEEGVVYPNVETVVVMEDGSEVHLENSMGSFNDEEHWHDAYGPFESPVDLSKAAYILWGDAQIPLN